jgi:hypothetical protein
LGVIVVLQRFTARALVASSLCVACSSEPGSETPSTSAGMANVAGSATTGGGGTGGIAAVSGSSSGGAGSSGVQAGSNAGGSPAAGGSAGAAQAGSGGSGGNAGGGSGGGGPPVMLEPCADPSVSHLKVWEMQVTSGTQVPANGSPLRKYDGTNYELYVEWTLQGDGYGTANAPLKNKGQYSNGIDPAQYGVDISQGPGITIEYSSTGNTYLQIRTGAVPHGGDHFRADLPSTDGQIKTISLALDSFRRPGGNTPPGDDVLKDAFSFTFVGGGTTKLALRQVLIPGFVPPCD